MDTDAFPFDPPAERSPLEPEPPCHGPDCTVEPLREGEPLVRHAATCPDDAAVARLELLLEDVVEPEIPDVVAAEEAFPTPTTAAVVIASEARDVLSYRDPEAVAAAARATRELVVGHIRDRAAELRARRESVQGDRRTTVGDLSAELREVADARDAISALSDALGAGRNEADAILRELVEETGRRSVRLGDGHGLELGVVLEQRRDLSVDVDRVFGVLRGALAFDFDAERGTLGGERERDRYLAGVDDAIGLVRSVLSTTPTFRTSALDALGKRLAGHDDGRARLAADLSRSYARVPAGEARVKIERKAVGDDE